MFGRSQSGPSGLSINTNAANAPSQPSASTNKPVTSLFGSTLNTTPVQQSASTSQPQTSSLFGNTTQQPQAAGGLFGSTNHNNNLGGGGSLFGSQQDAQKSGSLFGSTIGQQSQPQQTTGLFGPIGQNQNPLAQSQQQNKTFGGFGTQNKTSSLFGNTQSTAQGQQSTALPTAPSLFSSQIGQFQKQQTVPGVKVTVDELRPTTRFNDLHEEIQKHIETADNFILAQIRRQEDCFAANNKLEEMSSQMPPDVEYCAKTLDTMQQALQNDAESIAYAKNLVKVDFDDAKLSFQVVQNLSLPQQFHHSALRNSNAAPQPQGLFSPSVGVEQGLANIVDYFGKQADDMSNTLSTYNRNINEVENYLKGVESNTVQQMQQMMFSRTRDGGHKSSEDQVRELAVVLREFGHGILGVATIVGNTREKVQEHMLGS